MPFQKFRFRVNGRSSIDANAVALSVEPHKQQADVWVSLNVSERPVHGVAVVFRILDDVLANDLNEAGIARPYAAINIFPERGRNEKELRALYQFSLAVPKRVMFSMALDCVGNLATIELILEFPHSFVKKPALLK